MIYRDVNIALSQSMAQFANATGVNFADLIPLITTDREANLLQPGIVLVVIVHTVYPYFLIDILSNPDWILHWQAIPFDQR